MTFDENAAPYVRPDVGTTCYHCPSTTCDGHFYVSTAEFGREMTCPKCRLIVTLRHDNILDAPAKLEQVKPSQNWLSFQTFFVLLLGMILGFLLAWASTHF